jgi:hypothetical protein
MICFDTMTAWNTHHMAGCSHSICIECAGKMQSSIDSESNNDIDSDYDEISSNFSDDLEDIEDRLLTISREVPQERLLTISPQEFEETTVPEYNTSQFPIDYTVKYSLDGYKITRINYFDLEGSDNTLQCPYCRQHEPLRYDFDAVRFCVPSHTSEWNILEKKVYQEKMTSFTMNHDGITFAFKLSKDRSVLRIMWSEINKYAFTTPNNQYHNYSDHKLSSKRVKDARAYNRPKRYTKMVR